MVLELKKVKYDRQASKVSNAYDANLYIDGFRVCAVRNNGNGMPNSFIFNSEQDQTLLEQAKAYCLGIPITSVSSSLQATDIDSYLNGLADEYLLAKEIKRLEAKIRKKCQNKTLFMLTSDEPDEYRVVYNAYSPMVLGYLQNTYGTALKAVINEWIQQEPSSNENKLTGWLRRLAMR